ncbi:MAG: hypothetical protein GEV13_36400 [Rhodospirillales bacterium]|nr:hypothetical protein [Rhodospirillales bacterium]
MRLWAVLLVAVWVTRDGLAQQIPIPERMVGTTNIVSEPTLSGGKLLGCGLTYRAVIRDWRYRQGDPSIVFGSFGLAKARADTALGGFLKVVVQDLSMDGGRLVTTPNMPTSAYLLSMKGVATADDRVGGGASDQPGGLFTVFSLGGSFLDVMTQAIEAQKVSVMFARRAGGLDVPIELDLLVVDTNEQFQRTRNPKEMLAFAECLPRLLP